MGEWAAFERWYGPLLIHERVDVGLALMRWQANGGKGEPSDYLPQWAPHDDTETIMGLLEGMKRK